MGGANEPGLNQTRLIRWSQLDNGVKQRIEGVLLFSNNRGLLQVFFPNRFSFVSHKVILIRTAKQVKIVSDFNTLNPIITAIHGCNTS